MSHKPILAFLSLLISLVSFAETPPPPTAHYLMSGNIVTPDGILPHAWLEISNHHILHIEKEKPNIPGTLVLETNDLILPGFIDLHNHPSFNVLPRWTPPHKFSNRYAWRDWSVYQTQLESKARALQSDPANFCDIDEYVEVKALIGGTTSMIGLGSNDPAQPSQDCLKGLVRNLDHYTGFYGTTVDHERIANSIGILPRDMNADIAAHRAQEIAAGKLDLLAIHIAEGLPTDPESASELDLLEAHNLLGPHTALIHSVGLSPTQLTRVRKAGASIVWSPRSNFELYGQTANIAAAFRLGVTISLAPDWSPSGSDNMWEEIQFARNVNSHSLENLFTSHQLIEMAGSIPARVASIDDKVGSISPGMYADFFLVQIPPQIAPGETYEAVVNQPITAIDLVVIDGIPTYGDPKLLETLNIQIEVLTICGQTKALNSAALPAGNFAAAAARLGTKLKALGTELGPLDSCPQ